MDPNPSTSTQTKAVNAYTRVCGLDEDGEEEDYVLQIESASGRTRTRRAFVERVRWAATVLADDFHLGEDEGGEEEELVMICIENTADFPVLIHALLFLALPFILVRTPELESAMREHRPTRVFASRMKDAVRSIHALLASSPSSSSPSPSPPSSSSSFPVPRLYALSTYSPFCFPELWRMIAIGKRRRMPWVPMRLPSTAKEAERHAHIVKEVEKCVLGLGLGERVVQVDPVKELWTMLGSGRTYVILPQASSRL
ncbi:hypothetical protein CYLTODRAFT_419000 [Cylindrobasidium torrendii FP15055 ss-10]|uniref:AMP-dependent synthetase/ligase domain-containing protein n=1 Tax=Cylindrobasidium torrendii FP15055 ss-10 TaxID=1314674 RepID=A0A0D7BP08_9AGAR|nr:hypothetical protein CYLTODRAFT_419000 [Cylindrobasidium torrendii FP15055 ss-10]